MAREKQESLDRREEFVLSQFGKSHPFGSRTIEEWLHSQEAASAPLCDHEGITRGAWCVWCQLSLTPLLAMRNFFLIGDLLQHATPVDRQEEGNPLLVLDAPRLGFWSKYLPLLRMLSPDTQCYAGRDQFIVIKNERGWYIMDLSEDVMDPYAVLRRFEHHLDLANRAVADVLLGEWTHERPKAEAARAVLLKMVSGRLSALRTQFGEAYDTAVGITDKGDEVIQASWVAVCDAERRLMTFYRPSEFHHDKLVIEPEEMRVKLSTKFHPPPSDDDREAFLDTVGFIRRFIHHSPYQKRQVEIGGHTGARPVLYVPTDLCPEHLPIRTPSFTFRF